MRVLVDTNVVVDALQRREPWFQDGLLFFALSLINKLTVF